MESRRMRSVYGRLKGGFQALTQRMRRSFSRSKIEDITNEYINWLSFANAGILNAGNLWCFDYAISHLPDDSPIIEIGSFCGLSTNAIAYYKAKHEARNKLICSDAWEFEGVQGDGPLGDHPYLTHYHYREFVRSTFIRNVSFFSSQDLPFPVELNSDGFFSAWERRDKVTDVFGRELKLGGPISFAYIDGNHSYDFALRDFQNVDRWLQEDGFVLFDDSSDGSGWDVCRVVAEVSRCGRYQLIRKNPNYFFRKVEPLSGATYL